MTRLTLLALVLAAALQSPPAAPPELKEIERLKLQTLAQRIELAQLRAQAAQREFDVAREELSKLVLSLKIDGYTLDLQSLMYVKDAPPPKKDK